MNIEEVQEKLITVGVILDKTCVDSKEVMDFLLALYCKGFSVIQCFSIIIAFMRLQYV